MAYTTTSVHGKGYLHKRCLGPIHVGACEGVVIWRPAARHTQVCDAGLVLNLAPLGWPPDFAQLDPHVVTRVFDYASDSRCADALQCSPRVHAPVRALTAHAQEHAHEPNHERDRTHQHEVQACAAQTEFAFLRRSCLHFVLRRSATPSLREKPHIARNIN